MILTVDIGNTKSDFGIFKNDILQSRHTITTNKSMTVDEAAYTFSVAINMLNSKWSEIDAIVVSCVVPYIVSILEMTINKINIDNGTCIKLEFINSETVLNLDKSLYDIGFSNPSEVAPDYIAAVIGAKKLVSGPVIIVDLGTASNYALIDKLGKFYAGIIVPGVETGIKGLISSASALSDFVVKEPSTVAGYNTNECLNSGLIFGEAARIEGLVQRINEEQRYESKVILTGG